MLGLCFLKGSRWRSWLKHCATSRKVAVSIPGDIMGIFHWHNPSGRTVDLGLTQCLTVMSTRNISWGVKAASAYGWQPYHLPVPIVLKSGSPILLEPSGPVQACIGIALPLCFLKSLRLIYRFSFVFVFVSFLLFSFWLSDHFFVCHRGRVLCSFCRIVIVIRQNTDSCSSFHGYFRFGWSHFQLVGFQILVAANKSPVQAFCTVTPDCRYLSHSRSIF